MQIFMIVASVTAISVLCFLALEAIGTVAEYREGNISRRELNRSLDEMLLVASVCGLWLTCAYII